MNEVLIIEDDEEIVELLRIHLEDLNCNVTVANDGESGLDICLAGNYNLLLLDITLPGMDGIEVCQKVRSEKNIPIIMLTARTEEIDKVLGLEVGADDYITKPFSIRELKARIKAVFRRDRMLKDGLDKPGFDNLSFSGLSIDIEKRKVIINDNKVELSPKEFELLILMASNPGRSYSRSELLKIIWGYDFDGYQHTVNSHINRLRAKIESDMNDPQYILTTWGVGYKFNEDINEA